MGTRHDQVCALIRLQIFRVEVVENLWKCKGVVAFASEKESELPVEHSVGPFSLGHRPTIVDEHPRKYIPLVLLCQEDTGIFVEASGEMYAELRCDVE